MSCTDRPANQRPLDPDVMKMPSAFTAKIPGATATATTFPRSGRWGGPSQGAGVRGCRPSTVDNDRRAVAGALHRASAQRDRRLSDGRCCATPNSRNLTPPAVNGATALVPASSEASPASISSVVANWRQEPRWLVREKVSGDGGRRSRRAGTGSRGRTPRRAALRSAQEVFNRPTDRPGPAAALVG
jgi:hypothetical protein